jgi:hypothetical protein
MSEDDSTLNWQPEIKQATSVDSEDIPMQVYYANHGNFQCGEDASCWCAELLRRGKSTIKQMIGCPASSKRNKTLHDEESNNLFQQSSSTTVAASTAETIIEDEMQRSSFHRQYYTKAFSLVIHLHILHQLMIQ